MPYFVSVLLASTVSQRSRGEPTFSIILTYDVIALTRPFRTASLGQVRIGNVAVESKMDGPSERRLHETVHAGKSLFQLHVIYVTYILPPSTC